MGFQGLIFGAVAACWLVYLVPMLLNRREQGAPEEVEPSEPFGSSVTIVRRGTALDAAENGSAVVSTPHNRRAALRELADRDRETAGRRRNVMIFLSLLGITTAVLAAFGLVPWWVLTVPVGLLVAFLVVARFSVARLRRELDEISQKLSDRKLVDKAKGVLMKARGVDEDAAYHAMRKLAMERGQTMAKVARDVIDMARVLL